MQAQKNEAGLYAVDIAGVLYEFEKWGAERALDTLMDLGAVCGKPLGATISGLFGKGGAGLGTELSGDFIAELMQNVSQAFFERKQLCRDLVKKLCSGDSVFADGKRIASFDMHYRDRLEDIFKVARANIEVQYERFFSVASAAAGLAQQQLSATK